MYIYLSITSYFMFFWGGADRLRRPGPSSQCFIHQDGEFYGTSNPLFASSTTGRWDRDACRSWGNLFKKEEHML